MNSDRLTQIFKRDGWMAGIAALAIAFYFWRFSRYSVWMGFTHDDLMNLGRAIRDSYGILLRDMVSIWSFSESYRPAGGLFYLALYDTFGFSSVPFRIACLTVMAVNLVLIYGFYRLIAERREIAVLGVLLLAYKPDWPDLYGNTGYCYDLLCFTLYYGALYVYFRARLAGRLLSVRETALFVALIWIGLSTKEMIVTAPVVAGLAEVLWLDRRDALWRRLMPAAIASLTVLVFLKGRLYAAQGLGAMGAYTPEFTLKQFLDRGGHFLEQFLSLAPESAGLGVLLMFLAVCVAGVLSGKIGPRLSVAIMLLGVIPVIFIPGRSLAAAYIPAAGAAFLLAWALVEVSKTLFHFTWRPVLLFVLTFAILWNNAKMKPPDIPLFSFQGKEIQQAADGFRALNLKPPHDARLLMDQDPLPTFRWASTFLVWILYDDPSLKVDWMREPLPGQENVSHYAVLTTQDGRLVRLR